MDTATKKAASTTGRAAKGTGTCITIDFKDDLDLLSVIRDEARKDRRLPSLWLLLRLVYLDEQGILIPGDESEEESVNVKAGE
jgi:hypothetical protein